MKFLSLKYGSDNVSSGTVVITDSLLKQSVTLGLDVIAIRLTLITVF